MEQAILDLIQRLPESIPQEALNYLEDLVANHTLSSPTSTVNRQNAFGIWQGQVWMADDFNAPLDDLQE